MKRFLLGSSDIQAGVMLLLLAPIFSALLIGAAGVSPPRFVPGEVIIQFAAGTAASDALRCALQASPPDLGALNPVVSRLGEEADIPLKAVQVTGGQRVLFSVDGERLADRVADQLHARRHVAGVEVVSPIPGTHGRFPASKDLLVQFTPGSPESNAVARKLAGADGFSQLIRDLERTLNLPVKAEPLEGSRLRLRIDLHALTPILVERLNALGEVESAQPNYIVTIR